MKRKHKCNFDWVELVLENMKGFVRKGYEEGDETEIGKSATMTPTKSEKPACPDRPADSDNHPSNP